MLVPCPICDQPVDFSDITYRRHLYIDGKHYEHMCFTCAHTPAEYNETCDKKGNIIEQDGPYFDHKHLCTPETLVQIGAATTIAEATRSLQGVRRAIKKVGRTKLNKLRLNPPKHHTYLVLDDGITKNKKTKRKTAKKKTKVKS